MPHDTVFVPNIAVSLTLLKGLGYSSRLLSL